MGVYEGSYLTQRCDLKVNTVMELEFQPAKNHVAVQHVSHVGFPPRYEIDNVKII